MVDRVVYRFPDHGWGPTNLVRVGEARRDVHPGFEYAIDRRGVSVARVTIAYLTRGDLECLAAQIAAELGR